MLTMVSLMPSIDDQSSKVYSSNSEALEKCRTRYRDGCGIGGVGCYWRGSAIACVHEAVYVGSDSIASVEHETASARPEGSLCRHTHVHYGVTPSKLGRRQPCLDTVKYRVSRSSTSG